MREIFEIDSYLYELRTNGKNFSVHHGASVVAHGRFTDSDAQFFKSYESAEFIAKVRGLLCKTPSVAISAVEPEAPLEAPAAKAKKRSS